MTKNVDEALLSGQKDKDEVFIERRTFLEDYHNRIKETTKKSELLSASTNGLSVDYMQVFTAHIIFSVLFMHVQTTCDNLDNFQISLV